MITTTTITATAIHCPRCSRRLGDAEAARNVRFRCKSCGAHLVINVDGGTLTVSVEGLPEAT